MTNYYTYKKVDENEYYRCRGRIFNTEPIIVEESVIIWKAGTIVHEGNNTRIITEDTFKSVVTLVFEELTIEIWDSYDNVVKIW